MKKILDFFKIDKDKVRDLLIRTGKTFLAAGLISVVAYISEKGFTGYYAMLVTFGSAGATAVLNYFIKLLTK